MGQLKHQKISKRGRRFSFDEKVFALSLMKQSPKGYKLLKATFALPSRRTLMALLNKVPFHHGINSCIFEAIRKSAETMEALDRCCILMYDEMSISPGLSYNKRYDRIEGYSNFETSGTVKFANHVLVFMAKGLRRKWKQPIAYYFTHSGVRAADLMRVIKEIISALQDCGIYVMATVCDQLSSNVKCIKMLREETQRNHAIANKENKMFGFTVNGQEIIPIYDPPHLIKGLRNNLLQHDAKFVWNGKYYTASWDDLVNLYELDAGDCETRALHKLTDAHVIKEKIKKMKVKNAVQVFSHSVSSIMGLVIKAGNKN